MRGSTNLLRTLVYHRVEAPAHRHAELAPDLVSATPTGLERQLRFLARTYQPIDASEMLASIRGTHRLPSRAVLVTFDDGYRDFLEVAWPILRQFQIPVVLFVATDFVDEPTRVFWWDALWQMLSRTRRDHLVLPGLTVVLDGDRGLASRRVTEWLKHLTPSRRRLMLEELETQLGVRPESQGHVLSWPVLRQLQRDGVTIAPHSKSHELLDQLDDAELFDEVEGSRTHIARELDRCPPLFAYPNGNFNERVVESVRQAGFEAAFTTFRGASKLGVTHPLALRRDVGRRSLLYFALQLSQPVATLRIGRRRMPPYAEKAG